ncbi:MAG: hypothetical protein K6G91_09685 [Kiritimatiellae bacterium]|nr:hypothetical protein [Kiritimatiellia bacterium]
MEQRKQRRAYSDMRNDHAGRGGATANGYRKGAINGSILLVLLIIAGWAIFGIVRYNNHKRQQQLEARQQQEADRARKEAARKEEEELARKKDEEARREREAQLAKEREARLEAEKEAEKKRQEEEAMRVVQENYRQARSSFGSTAAAFYFEAPKDKRVGESESVFWYVDESFIQDSRIYEIKSGGRDVFALYPDRPAESCNSTRIIASLDSKSGLLAGDGHVWICGVGENEKTYEVPESGSDFVPIDRELGDVLDASMALDVKPPKKRYRITLRKKDGENVALLGIVNADDVVSRETIENAVRDILEKKMQRRKSSLKRPTLKKMKRTVVFYDGDIIKTDIHGVKHIPRKFVYLGTRRRYLYPDYISIESARCDWERLRDKAQKEDEEEKALFEQNRIARDEFERKSAAENSAVTGDSAVEAYLDDCELLVQPQGGKVGDPVSRKPKVSSESRTKTRNVAAARKSCYKCHGNGTVSVRVREKCDECGGKGVIETDVMLKDTKYDTDGYWNYKRIGSKKSKKRETCPKCRRTGRISVEKEIECPTCKGAGEL